MVKLDSGVSSLLGSDIALGNITPTTTIKINNSSTNSGFEVDAGSSKVQVVCKVRTRIPTTTGQFYLHLYHNNTDNKEHLALVFGNSISSQSLATSSLKESQSECVVRGVNTQSKDKAENGEQQVKVAPLVRVHSECFTGETVLSARCDCGEQLNEAMRLMERENYGVIVYLRQEGRGIGLLDKLRAYNIQDLGYDTVAANLMLSHPADARNYNLATAILRDLGIHQLRLLTNNPEKLDHLEQDGIKVVERVPMIPKQWQYPNHDPNHRHNHTNSNSPSSSSSTDSCSDSCPSPTPAHSLMSTTASEADLYLQTKVERMGHLLHLPSYISKPNLPPNQTL